MKKNFKKKLMASDRTRGFTLIELLVVISIIGLLSSVVLASLVQARDKAKGTAFRQEVNQYILALELYRSDNNGNLPTGLATDDPVNPYSFLNVNLTKYSITRIPEPPFGGGIGFFGSDWYDDSVCGNGPGDGYGHGYNYISVSGTEELKYFKDWEDYDASFYLGDPNAKCFSLE